MEPVLQLLGMSDTENVLYRALLEEPGASSAQIAQRAGMSSAAVRQSFERLETLGLISRIPESKRRYVPAPPDVALEALVSRREEELKRVRLEAAQLAERFAQRIRDHQGVAPVEFVRGHDATYHRWVQVQRSAKREIRLLDKPPYVVTPGEPNPEELALLSTGISYRVIYDQESFDVPGKFDSAMSCVAAGERSRVMTGVPVKLMVADDSLALTHNPQHERVQDILVVHRSGLLNALIVLFDTLWERAIPIGQSGEPSQREAEIDDLDRQILALLAAGAKDEAVASRLAVGLRTVRRRMQLMMELLDADTRFEAGVRAKERGWIN